MEMLSVRGLKKRFGDREVLKGVELSVPEHSVFGFVGLNGAGKTTTMKAVLGLLKPDAGEILAAGERVAYGRTASLQMGYLPDVPEFYGYMTPLEYLELCGQAAGMKAGERKARSRELLERCGLAGETHRIKGFSRGMKQRLGIAQALLSRPRLLICDEPTSALDPMGRKEILELLAAVRAETTVIFSTHILADVERICTDVAFLNGGKVTVQGSVSKIREMHASREFLIEVSHEGEGARLRELVPALQQTGKTAFQFSGGEEELFSLLRTLAGHRIGVEKLERIEPSLESLFLEVTAQ